MRREPLLCATCLALPGWFKDEKLRAILDPGGWSRPDPPAPPWVINVSVGIMIGCLLVMLMELYRGGWIWAAVDATMVMVNALGAYFNTLALSVRVRALRIHRPE